MNTFRSDVVLAHRYTDSITGITGVCDSVHFYRNSCERVRLIYVHDGEAKEISVDAFDLVDADTKEPIRKTATGGPDRAVPPRR
jgi:hypothetical protein